MKDYFFNLGISIILTELKTALKDPVHARRLKSVMLKIYNSIKSVYADDADFQ